MEQNKYHLWKYITYQALALNSSFVFPLEYFFTPLRQIDNRTLTSCLQTQDNWLYIHIPFCTQICDYCGCYKLQMTSAYNLDEYVEAMIAELGIIYDLWGGVPLRFSTWMFGGGTASILSDVQLERLFSGLEQYIDPEALEQISFESSPSTLSDAKLKVLKKHSVTRISIGVQSFQESVMQANNRVYVSYEKIQSLITSIHDLGMLVQLDLMIGIKWQDEANCIDDYKKMIDLGVDSYTMNYYIPHGFANFSDTKTSLKLKEKMRLIDSKRNHITADKNAYLLQEDYVFNNFSYSVIGLWVGATSNIWNTLIYRKTDFENYYSSLEAGKLPSDDGIVMGENFPAIKYIFEKYKDGEIDRNDFKNVFWDEILQVFTREFEFLKREEVVEIQEEKIIFLKNRLENRVFLNVFLEDVIDAKWQIDVPELDAQFHLDLTGLIYE